MTHFLWPAAVPAAVESVVAVVAVRSRASQVSP